MLWLLLCFAGVVVPCVHIRTVAILLQALRLSQYKTSKACTFHWFLVGLESTVRPARLHPVLGTFISLHLHCNGRSRDEDPSADVAGVGRQWCEYHH